MIVLDTYPAERAARDRLYETVPRAALDRAMCLAVELGNEFDGDVIACAAAAFGLSTDDLWLHVALRADQWPDFAALPTCPAGIIPVMVRSHSPSVATALATNRSLTAPQLRKIANRYLRDSDSTCAMWDYTSRCVVGNVAANPNCPTELLRQLAPSVDLMLRTMVATNPATPPEVLEALADDTTPDVRRQVASNPSTPAAALESLATAGGFDPTIAQMVAANESAPADLLTRLVHDPELCTDRIRAIVAANPSTPPLVLAFLANPRASSGEVCARLASNPSTPLVVLAGLARHTLRGVATNAAHQLAARAAA